MTPFALHPRLAADSRPVTELALSSVRLIDDSAYPWLVLVPKRAGAREIIDLGNEDLHLLMEEIALACRVMRAETGADKLNVATLGNQVAQLHVHVIGRFRTDAAWPGPVWGKAPRVSYGEAAAAARVGAFRARFAELRGGPASSA